MLAFIQLIQNCKIQVFFTAKQLFFFRYFFKTVVEVNSSSSKLIQNTENEYTDMCSST